MERKNEPAVGKLISVAGVMAGASIALVGIIFLIAYEFYHASDMTGFLEWVRTAHLATFSAISFAVSTVAGLVHESLKPAGKTRKILKWVTIITFLFGWVFMFIVLGKIFLETWNP